MSLTLIFPTVAVCSSNLKNNLMNCWIASSLMAYGTTKELVLDSLFFSFVHDSTWK